MTKPMDLKKCVFFWMLGGENDLNAGRNWGEASTSVKLVRKHMPDIARYLYTDSPGASADHLTHIVRMDPSLRRWGNHWHITQVAFMLHAARDLRARGFERAIHMHCDAWMLRPVYDLFEVLDGFEMAAVYEESRATMANIGKVPEAFPEPTGCGLTLRLDDRSEKLLTDWLALYEADPRDKADHIYDQNYLRTAIYRSDIRFLVLPPEYNMRSAPCDVKGYATYPVKIVHGRGNTPDEYERLMNNGRKDNFKRVWSTNEATLGLR